MAQATLSTEVDSVTVSVAGLDMRKTITVFLWQHHHDEATRIKRVNMCVGMDTQQNLTGDIKQVWPKLNNNITHRKRYGCHPALW